MSYGLVKEAFKCNSNDIDCPSIVVDIICYFVYAVVRDNTPSSSYLSLTTFPSARLPSQRVQPPLEGGCRLFLSSGDL